MNIKFLYFCFKIWIGIGAVVVGGVTGKRISAKHNERMIADVLVTCENNNVAFDVL